ncbi:MAG TPA: hypothetical protein VM163_00985 [bacterium]|nr:hypothetical protein [bacterium]
MTSQKGRPRGALFSLVSAPSAPSNLCISNIEQPAHGCQRRTPVDIDQQLVDRTLDQALDVALLTVFGQIAMARGGL